MNDLKLFLERILDLEMPWRHLNPFQFANWEVPQAISRFLGHGGSSWSSKMFSPMNSYWAPYFLDKWHWWASHSRLDPIMSLAKTIKEHRQGILNYSKSKISNGILKGLNSLFKAAVAKAQGYRTLRHACHHGVLPGSQ